MDSDNLLGISKKTYYLNYAGKLFFHPIYVSSMSKWMIESVRLLQNSCFCCLVIDQDGISTKEEPKTLIDLRSQLQTSSIGNIQKQLSAQKTQSVKSSNDSQITLCDTSSSSTENLPFHVSYNQVVEVLMPIDFQKKCFGFIVHQAHSNPLILHVYHDENEQMVKEIGETIKHFMTWKENPSSKDGNSFIRHLKLEDLESIKFEALLLGKIQVNSDVPRSTVIDEAVEKYFYLMKEHNLNQTKTHPKDANANRHSTIGKTADSLPRSSTKREHSPLLNRATTDTLKSNNPVVPSSSKTSRTSVNLAFDKNKTKIIQVGKQSIVLISPDQSFQDIDIPFSHVASCEKGRRYKDHFGIFLKDVSYNNFGGAKKSPKPDAKPRCFVLRCSEGNVCTEITQAIKQACSSCVYGPDPMKAFHSLCKRIRMLTSNNERSSPETGIDLAATCIADMFTEPEQIKVKYLISEACRKISIKSTFEHLVVIIEMLRQIFEERQYAHEMKIKHLTESPNSSQSLGVGKQFNLLNEKARRSFGNLFNILEKYHLNTPNPPSRASIASQRSNSPRVSQSIDDNDPLDFNPHQLRLTTTSTEKRTRTRHKTGGPELGQPHPELQTQTPKAPVASANPKGRSYSSPYLLRLISTLPDLKELPSEGENPTHLKPSRFSFSRLFRASPVCSKPVEMEDMTKKTQVCDQEKSEKTHRNLAKKLLSEPQQTSDVSSDEDDHGIFFSAGPNMSKESPLSGHIKTMTSKRPSAFTPVTPQKNTNLPFSDPLSVGLDTRENADSNCSTFGRRNTPSDLEDDDDFATPLKSQLTIHHRIFNMVGTTRADSRPDVGPLILSDYKRTDSHLTTPADIREAWKRAITDQIILNKIQNQISSSSPVAETANASSACLRNLMVQGEMHNLWMAITESEKQKMNAKILHAAVKREIPPDLRGRIWKYLCQQWKLREECCCYGGVHTFKLPNKSYDSLLKELTTHQHAILIDLGRTFPTHPYFSRQMGNGQLALFNLLKAYSLVDEGVGYCQGLSFVAGVLLINLSDASDAFDLLCHLMVKMNCRKFYLPDMIALRIAVYQLSRLLFDFHSDLWHHLEKCEVTLMLFSTPWFLTMFASVLSLEFTARIFDLLFVEGPSALFKTALCLLGCHKKKLLMEDGFENVMNYLKQNLPNMDQDQIDSVTTEMFGLDIGDRLCMYEAEYKVLEESHFLNNDNELRFKEHVQKLNSKCSEYFTSIRQLEKRNIDLADQLSAANLQIESLRQGLSDFTELDLQRKRQVDILRKENESLKKGNRI